MKSLKKIMMATFVLLSLVLNAQIKNAKTETVKIFGNCGMCETAIEKSGSLKKVAQVDWNQDTKMATLTYDTSKTNQDEILKRIALAGYDSEKFLAPDSAYAKLAGCCQYDREAKVSIKPEMNSEVTTMENHSNHSNHSNYTTEAVTPKAMQAVNQLKPLFDTYFALKDALVKTDSNTAASKANELATAVNAVKMDQLEMDVHMVWMKVVGDLKQQTQRIAKSKDVKEQRGQFMELSKKMYDLIQVAKQESPTYYQFCPMANEGKGANWLSKENAIKNPYYGSMMLTCGKTVETIK